MTARGEVWHAWTQQLAALLPQVHRARVTVLALFSLGMIWAGTVRLHRVATSLPCLATVPSRERRLQRFLANPQVTVEALWLPLLPALLARWADQEVTLVLDPTPYRKSWTVVWVGIVCHRRVLPLTWRLLPQRTPWPEAFPTLIPALLAPIAAALPPGCRVTLLGDRGVSGPVVRETAHVLGWETVLRLNVSETQTHRLRLPDGQEWRLWDWVAQVGSGWHGPVAIAKGAGWRDGYLTIYQQRGEREPWVLVSSQPGGRDRVTQYRRRTRVEATFADGKRRGWDLEHSRVEQLAHLDRLLLLWHLAMWWLHGLGRDLIRAGRRHHFDRRHRRERSLIRLGYLWLLDRLDHDGLPPLLFRLTPSGWSARGTP